MSYWPGSVHEICRVSQPQIQQPPFSDEPGRCRVSRNITSATNIHHFAVSIRRPIAGISHLPSSKDHLAPHISRRAHTPPSAYSDAHAAPPPWLAVPLRRRLYILTPRPCRTTPPSSVPFSPIRDTPVSRALRADRSTQPTACVANRGEACLRGSISHSRDCYTNGCLQPSLSKQR